MQYLERQLFGRWLHLVVKSHLPGAEPCTGSNNDGNFPVGLMSLEAATPSEPVKAGPRLLRI